ncbi:MAG TPA: hypothetical protein VHZ24_04570 [Pirellulales bacterium]|jgi:hypothetical protein|nr:hypothetical protein [Pirellulales bacterium]
MFSLATILETLGRLDPFWASVWAVLAAITVVLLVLLATRRRDAEPLHKYIVLSIWAHVLLATYAGSVRVMLAGPGAPRESIIHLALTETPATSDPAAEEHPADKPVAPWDEFPAQPLPKVNEPAPERVANESPPSLAEPSSPADEPPAPSLPQEALHKIDAPPAEAAPTPVQDRRPRAEPSAPETIEVAKPEARPAPELKPTAVASPPPVATPTPEAAQPSTPPPAAAALIGRPGMPAALAERADVPHGREALARDVDSTGRRTAPAPADEVASPDSATIAAGRAARSKSVDELLQSSIPALPRITTGPVVPDHDTPKIYTARLAPDHTAQASSHGGSPETEGAVKAALAWLAHCQAPDGRWDASQFGAGQEPRAGGQDRRGAGARADTGITGLALLALLGSGHTHTRGQYQATVARGVDFLIRSQGPRGELGGDAEVYAFMYCHGMASLALSEAYAMSGDPRLERPVQRAIAYTLGAQNRSTGGWRYRPGDTGDTSQLGWQLMALKSAELAGIPINTTTREGMLRFLASVSSGTHGGLASYRPGERVSRTMTAEAMVCRQFLGVVGPGANEAAESLLEELPGKSTANMYYWYYATLGLYQMQGEAWTRWNAAIAPALVESQRREGDLAGSWDPDKVWGPHGGRVYSTALATLCLEVYYRYLPLYVEAAKLDATAR